MYRLLTFVLPATLALATPAAAQPHGWFGGGGGGRPFGPGQHRNGTMGPGTMGQANMGHPRIGPYLQRRFDRANRSHDGHLTQAQARDGNMPVIAHHFDEIDTDHKGYVTMDQVEQFRAGMAAKRQAAQGNDAPADPDGPQ